MHGDYVIMTKIKEIICENCPSGIRKYISNIDKVDLHNINREKLTKAFKKGEFVFQEGQKPSYTYCIREGKIKVFKNGQDGREHITRVALPGEFLGLKAILTGNPHSFSSVALEDSVICYISKTDFFYLMIKYPEFSQSLIIILGTLLEEAEARMLSLAYKPVRERLAETILFLFNSFYPHSGKSPHDYLNLTRAELANIIGTAPETVIRLLSEFKEGNLIAIKGRKIFLTDPVKLQIIANLKD
jgi:CRP/FNR family transcriptional regulator, polysaccharide utilization system transcription regulator